ncbi:MAG: phosphoheptose isomerase family protein [Candidatus Methanospirareceae archaeon]
MAVKKVSNEVGYINTVTANVRNIKKSEFKPFFDALSAADCIILVGEGRSQSALYIGMGQMKKAVKTMVDIDFPGRNIVEAAPLLEKKYEKIVLLVNSGSGETTTPKIVVKELSDYIEREKSDKFTIAALVSNTDSTIGKIGEKEYGHVVELKGRRKKKNITNEYLKHGIMNDVYELGSLLLFQKTKEAINEGKGYTAVFRKVAEESTVIGKIVDQFVSSEKYHKLIDELETRSRIIVGGLGPARNVAKMTAIRLQHVKRAIGDEAYLSGPFAPRPRARDILLLISWSGETEPILGWCREQKRFGTHVYSIVGNESPLSRESESFIIDSPSTTFYERATFALSPLPMHLVERLNKRKFALPEYIMEWWEHSVTQ